MASAENIIDLIRRLLREESGSDVPVIEDTFLFEAINDGQGKWEDAFQSGGEGKTQRETGFNLVADTALAENITSATTDFDVDSSTSLDSSGVVLIWDENTPDFVPYTGNSSNNLTGVTGIGFDHEDGDSVQKLYKLPTNFGSFKESAIFGDGVIVDGVPYRFIAGIPKPGFFSLYENGDDKYLVLPRDLTGDCGVLYNPSYTTVDSLDDVVSVPDKYKFFLVWHAVSYCLSDIDSDLNKSQLAQNKSEEILFRALRNRNEGKKIRTRPLGRITRDYTVVGGVFFPLRSE